MEYRPFNAGEEGVLSPGLRADSEQYVTLALLEEDGGRYIFILIKSYIGIR